MKTKSLIVLLLISLKIFSQIPKDSLMYWYPYNGNTKDSSKHKLGVLYESNISYTTDRFNNENGAAYFNGNAFIQMKDSNYLDYSSKKEFSAGLWIKADLVQPNFSQNAIFSIDSDCSDFRYSFQIKNQTNILFANGGSATEGNSGCWNFFENNLNFGNWVHIAVVANDKEYKMYFNGQLIKTRSLSSVSYSFYASKMMVGAWRSRGSTTTTGYFKGAVDDLFTYNKALTDQEVYDIYNYQPITTSNKVLSKEKVIIFPNPASGNTTFSFPYSNGVLTVSNLLGEVVYQNKINSESLRLDVKDWKKGVYLVYFQSNNSNFIQKLIVK